MISLEILQSVLRHIFVERTVEIQDAQVWSRLATAACPCNGMVLMDESLQLLPVVEALDLSRNNLAKVANLQKCLRLKFLDLGFNHITSVASLNEVQVQIYQNMDMGTSSLHLSVLSWQEGKKNCTVVHSDLHSL